MSAKASSELNHTISKAGFIGLTTFGGALVGFVLQLLVAYYFGASSDTDAYFMAQSTSDMLSKLLLGGSITAVFLPMFVDRITRNERDEAWRLGLNIFNLAIVAMGLILILLSLFAAPFVHFIAPGFSPATSALTANLLRVLLPSFLMLFLVDLATSMLYSLRQFRAPAVLRIVAPLASILAVSAFARSIGIYSLAAGVVAGSIVQLVVVYTALHRRGFHYRWVLDIKDPALRHMFYLVYPFFLSVLATQGAGIVYRILVSDLSSGSLSAIKYAEKITQMITIMFLNSVTIVIFPLLSQQASRRDYRDMRETIGNATRLIAFVTVPIIIGVIALRQPLINLVYRRGSFSEADAALTSLALLGLIIGLTINGISSVFGHATLALKQTRASVAVSIASQAVAISLFVWLVPRLGLLGLALGSSLVPLAIALLYYLYLTRFINELWRVFWHKTYLKIGILAALLLFTTYLAYLKTQDLSSIRSISLLLNIILPTLAGCAVFFGGAYIWRVPEMREVVEIARSKINGVRVKLNI